MSKKLNKMTMMHKLSDLTQDGLSEFFEVCGFEMSRSTISSRIRSTLKDIFLDPSEYDMLIDTLINSDVEEVVTVRDNILQIYEFSARLVADITGADTKLLDMSAKLSEAGDILDDSDDESDLFDDDEDSDDEDLDDFDIDDDEDSDDEDLDDFDIDDDEDSDDEDLDDFDIDDDEDSNDEDLDDFDDIDLDDIDLDDLDDDLDEFDELINGGSKKSKKKDAELDTSNCSALDHLIDGDPDNASGHIDIGDDFDNDAHDVDEFDIDNVEI